MARKKTKKKAKQNRDEVKKTKRRNGKLIILQNQLKNGLNTFPSAEIRPV
jgi:hypothetical protein